MPCQQTGRTQSGEPARALECLLPVRAKYFRRQTERYPEPPRNDVDNRISAEQQAIFLSIVSNVSRCVSRAAHHPQRACRRIDHIVVVHRAICLAPFHRIEKGACPEDERCGRPSPAFRTRRDIRGPGSAQAGRLTPMQVDPGRTSARALRFRITTRKVRRVAGVICMCMGEKDCADMRRAQARCSQRPVQGHTVLTQTGIDERTRDAIRQQIGVAPRQRDPIDTFGDRNQSHAFSMTRDGACLHARCGRMAFLLQSSLPDDQLPGVRGQDTQ